MNPPYRIHTKHFGCLQFPQRPEVGAVVDTVGCDPVRHPVAGQEQALPAGVNSLQHRVRGLSEGGIDGMLTLHFEAGQPVQSGPADNRQPVHKINHRRRLLYTISSFALPGLIAFAA